jgi:hypothetical protein
MLLEQFAATQERMAFVALIKLEEAVSVTVNIVENCT